MPNFVYDDLDLPTDKVDSRPLRGPANESVTATEWNNMAKASKDLREAILSGQYHGLTSNPDAAVSPAGGVRIRNNAGVLEVSENGGPWTAIGAASVASAEAAAVAADGSADAAASSASAAASAKTAAETARDAANSTGKVYPDTASGIAAVADGAYFSVPSATASESLILYRRSGGAAVEVKRYPSTQGVAQVAPVLKSIAVNGNLANSGAGIAWDNGTPTISALVDTYLNGIGCSYAAVMSTLASGQAVYYPVKSPSRPYENGDWVAASVFIVADNWDWLAGGSIRLLLYVEGSGSGQVANLTSYEAISSTCRRYYGVAQLAMPNGTKFFRCWMHVGVPAGRTAVVRTTGYALALSEQQPGAVDWADFDPFSVSDHEDRITVLEGSIPSSAMSDPGLIVPSSLHLVKGRPLTVYKHGLTEMRELNGYDIEFVGSSGTRPFIGYVGRSIDLDGSRLSGAGAIWSRPGPDVQTVFKKPVTFYASAASKVGSPRILVIGDSLTYQGTVSAMRDKLVEAGLTPSFIGTMNDVAGVPCEGRSSWEFSDFTRKLLTVNTNGTAPTYPIDATGGDGLVTNVAQYLTKSADIQDVGSRWTYNPFIRPTTGGDDPAFVKNGYIFDMRFYLDRFGYADPDIVIIALGTNDTGSNDQATGNANAIEGLGILYAQTRAALPNAKIAIVVNGFPSVVLWQKHLAFIQYVLEEYGDREAEGVFVLPVYMVQDTKTLYGITVSSTDAMGVQTGAISEWVHADAIGRSQWAEMTFAFVMNQI